VIFLSILRSHRAGITPPSPPPYITTSCMRRSPLCFHSVSKVRSFHDRFGGVIHATLFNPQVFASFAATSNTRPPPPPRSDCLIPFPYGHETGKIQIFSIFSSFCLLLSISSSCPGRQVSGFRFPILKFFPGFSALALASFGRRLIFFWESVFFRPNHEVSVTSEIGRLDLSEVVISFMSLFQQSQAFSVYHHDSLDPEALDLSLHPWFFIRRDRCRNFSTDLLVFSFSARPLALVCCSKKISFPSSFFYS